MFSVKCKHLLLAMELIAMDKMWVATSRRWAQTVPFRIAYSNGFVLGALVEGTN